MAFDGPGAARIYDVCSGHGCFPSRMTDQGSPDKFVNGRAVHRQYDHWTIHCCPKQGCHDSMLASGSMIDYTNGVQTGRIADPVACGSIVATGSPDSGVGPAIFGPGSPGNPIDLVYYKYFRAGDARAGDRLLNIRRGPNVVPF